MFQLSEPYRLFFSVVIALFVFGLALHLFNRFSKATPSNATFSLEDTLADIKRELKALEDAPGPRLGLLLRDITITLLVQEDDSQSGNAKLAVPVFDESALEATEERTVKSGSKITVVLVPPKGDQVLSSPPRTNINFANLLTSTRRALHDSMESEPKLDPKSIEVELSFVLVASKSQNASVKAKVVSVGAKSGWQHTNSNTVVLKYANPAYQTKDDKSDNGGGRPAPP